MTLNTTRWVLWVSLMVILPLPVYAQQWGCLPAAYLFVALIVGEGHPALLLAGQALVWALIFQGIAHIYCLWSAQWQAKIRGSVMSLAVFVTLIVVASVPVYRVPYGDTMQPVTLSWLYE